MRKISSVLIRLGKFLRIPREGQQIWQRFSRNFSISFAGSIALMAIGLARTALLTKCLAIADYGKILIITNLFTFLGAFLSLRVDDVIYRFYSKFEQENNINALRSLLILCLILNTGVGLIIAIGVFIIAPWIATRFYQDISFTPLFRIYCLAAFVSVLGEVYTSVLLLKNRFSSVIIPQVTGAVVTLLLLAIYFYSSTQYKLEPIIGAFTVGILIKTLPPLIQSLHIIIPQFLPYNEELPLGALGKDKRELLSTLFQTNLAGYFKLVFSPGDIFILGILSSPTQVALYNLAQTLTTPLTVLQNNIQAAITPEIASLWAKNKIEELKQFIRQYLILSFIFSTIAIVSLMAIARPLILLFSNSDYLATLPSFYLLSVISWSGVFTLIFYPLGLCMGFLKWFNLANLTNVVILIIVLVKFDGLTALSMACIQITVAFTRRFLVNLPLLVWSYKSNN